MVSFEFAATRGAKDGAFVFCRDRYKVSVMPVILGMPSPVIPGSVIPAGVIARSMTARIYVERIRMERVPVQPRSRGIQSAVRCIPETTMPPGGRPITPVSTSISETVLLYTPMGTQGRPMEAPEPWAQVSEAARRKTVCLCVSVTTCGNEKCCTKHCEEP
jgi:hypothetical protein